MNSIYISLFFLGASFCIQAMDLIKTIPLAGPAEFSSTGKHLLVFEEKNVAVYETITGKKLGSLQNLSLEKWQPDSFIFSPQETFVALGHKIWTLADQKEYVPQFSTHAHIKAWNTQETILLAETIGLPQWYTYEASTGFPIRPIAHPHMPSDFSLSDDGSLVSFTYPTYHPIHHNYPRTKTVITNIKSNKDPIEIIEISDGQQTRFFPDNTHALVANTQGEVLVINAKLAQNLHLFLCANSINSFTTACHISISNMKSTITHPSVRDGFFTINYDGQKFCFEKHDQPYRALNLESSTRQFRVYAQSTGYSNNLFLIKAHDSISLMPSVKAREKDVTFAGEHDEHILVQENKEGHLYILYAPSTEYLGRIDYKSIAISPDKNSFEITTRAGKNLLYILPRVVDILGKQNRSYFSLLPLELRLYLRNLQTVQRHASE